MANNGIWDFAKAYLSSPISTTGATVDAFGRMSAGLAPWLQKPLEKISGNVPDRKYEEDKYVTVKGQKIPVGKKGEDISLRYRDIPAKAGEFLFKDAANVMKKINEGAKFDDLSMSEKIALASVPAELIPGVGLIPDIYRLAKAAMTPMVSAVGKSALKTAGDLITPIGVTDTRLSMPITKMKGATGPQGISRIKQAQRIKNKAKLQTFFDNNPEVVQKFKDGDMKIPKMIELADLRNHKGKLVADETFKALFRLTEQGGGKGPQAFVKGHWVGRPKGYMSPEQDTFLLNVVQQRLKEGHSYEGLRSSLQKYIRDNPELLKQAEELKLTGYPDMKLQDRIKRLIEGKEKNLSEANQAIVNTLREAKEAAPKKAEWHTLKESAIKNLSKENQKIALTYADEIINYAEPSLQSAVRKSTYGSLKRMIARAQTKKVGASEAEILEVLKNVDKEAISKIYQKQGTLVNKIKEARELGVTIDDFGDIDLSHIADVANHWKLTMDADNLFFGFKSLNRGDQIKLNNRIDDILSEFPHAKNYAEKRELAKKMIKIRKLLEENDLISVVRGKQIGKKDPTDPTLFEKKTKTLGELMQSQRQSQLIDEYGVKHGGLVGINHLTRPI
jgi:hypothetical protein